MNACVAQIESASTEGKPGFAAKNYDPNRLAMDAIHLDSIFQVSTFRNESNPPLEIDPTNSFVCLYVSSLRQMKLT